MLLFKQLYRRYWLVKCFWWLGVVIPGVPFVLLSIGLLIFMHWPRDYQNLLTFNVDERTQYLTLSAHGVKDSAKSWSDPLQEEIAKTSYVQLSGLHKAHISLAWQPYSNNALLCSVAGKNLGIEIGKKLYKLSQLSALHLIGHSCGAFIIYGICQELKSSKNNIHIQTTYLDPVSIYSGMFWQYGVKNFGSCANFSDTYIDTQDGVPGSNQVIDNSFTFDVTPLRTINNRPFSPHNWPPHFYIEAYKNKQVPISYKADDDLQQKYISGKMNNHNALKK